MKKTLIIIGITVAIVAIIKAPKMVHRYKTYALRAKISLAKSILKCSKENQNCIKPGELTYKDALKHCPKIQCLVENDTKYYTEFYRKPLSAEESIQVLKGNLFEGKKNMKISGFKQKME